MPRAPAFQTRAAHIALLLATTALGTSLAIGPARAQNLPTGGSVAAGNATIAAPTPTQMNVTQTSQSAVVNWQSFSVGQGYSVNIQQPNSTSALLNRVTGNAPSTIAGSITANGQVYLVNPNGIAITSTGVVNTGGFVASTLGISDSDFMSGKRTFAGNDSGASAGVSNAGTITTGRGGYAALIGGTVENSGNILVPLGKVGLGSGERVTLDFSGDGFLQVATPTKSGGNDALIRNSGTIRADGGSVIISAATARDAARNAVNISGVVQARTIGGRSGSIVIGGGLGGAVKITGDVTATARHTTGGVITVTGQHIVLDGAVIDVTGRNGGGTINIGGGRQGQGPLQHADTLSVDTTTTIRADATTSGNGGNVVLWSDQLTTFAGTITARGGFQSGNGGEAEVSGKAKLAYTGFTDLSASNGAFGTLLLDPYNVTISNGANNTGGGFVANTNDSIINAATLQTALGSANVTITTGSGGAQAGNITVAAPLTWSTATTLSLTAAGGITINAPISITGAGGLALTATAQAGITSTGLAFGNGASVDYGATDNGGTFRLNGNSYKLVYSMAQLDAIDGINAVDGTALMVYGTGLSGRYALATNLTATGTTYTRALIGTNSTNNITSQFRGTLDGLGHTITGLTINAPGTDYVGLIGFQVNRSVSNIGLVNGSVTGHDQVGSLIGFNQGGTVQGSFSTGTVTGNDSVGGLIGTSFESPVQSSYATGAVTGRSKIGGLAGEANFGSALLNTHATGTVTGTGANIGGLIGDNSGGTLDNSYATGAVTGATSTGGLAGYNNQIIQNSYATGVVTGGDATGGLVGRNDGTVDASHATGNTSGDDNTGGLVGFNTLIVKNSYATGVVMGDTHTGGLIGVNNFGNTEVRNSYATGAVTGTGDNTGGLIGLNGRGIVDGSHATGAVIGGVNAGGLVGYNTQTIQNSYATGTVNGTGSTGGLLGYNEGIVDHSYATGTVTGDDVTGGLVGFNRSTGTVQFSHATGAVFGRHDTGGLIGMSNFGSTTVQDSYATGTVTGTGENTGGLIGSASGGVIDRSYATGAVFGVDYTGGLAGVSTQTIQNSYATGAVTATGHNTGGLIGGTAGGTTDSSYATGAVLGNTSTGGLVGYSNQTIQNSYSTGAVTGGSDLGGLIGYNDGTVTTSYWDRATSGLSVGIGGGVMSGATGLTTAQLQGTTTVSLGASFSGGAAGGTAGLYPYLTSFFPGGVQAVSGFAYKNAGVTPAASGANGAVFVGLTVDGVTQSPVTTGANGYYYFALPAGSISGSGTYVLATTAANVATGSVKAAAVVNATGSVTGLDIYGGLLQVSTAATSYSTSGYSAAMAYANTSNLVGGLTSSIAATGSSFTLDQAITLNSSFAVTTTGANAPLTVAAAITLAGANTLTLNAAGALTINAPIDVTGAGSVVFTATAQSGITTSGLTFGNGASVDYGATDHGGTFRLNGNNYTLVYSMAQLDAIDGRNAVNGSALTVYGTGRTGNYALAHNLAAAGTTYTRAVVGDIPGVFPFIDIADAFSGRLDGLGHVVTDLTINAPSKNYVGLVGFLVNGTVSNIGVVGGSITGRSNVGAVAGIVSSAIATVQNSYATATVTSIGSGSSSTGGLVGANNGLVQSSYATGAVTGAYYVGGLVGDSMADVKRSFATGKVTGIINVGGLVGYSSGDIVAGYATGAVSGGDQVGGLLGTNSLSGGFVSDSYSTGFVSGTTNIGGLIGSNYGFVTSSYWNTETSRRSNGMGSDSRGQSANVIARTTAQLQNGSLPAGFSSAWGSVTGLYPYLLWQFPAGTTPQAPSGSAPSGVPVYIAASTDIVASTVNNAMTSPFNSPSENSTDPTAMLTGGMPFTGSGPSTTPGSTVNGGELFYADKRFGE